MKKILLFATVAAVGFSSCSQDEIIENVNNANAIGFSSYVGQSPITRADNENLSDGDFGVYAIYGGTTVVDWNASTIANLYSNLKVTSTSGSCSIDSKDTKYWSQADHYYSFLAYSPYSSSVNYTNGGNASPYISVTDNNGTDYLIANTAGQRETNFSDNKVSFVFKHAMSKLSVTLTTSMTGASVTPSSIVIGENTDGFYTSGNLNLLLGSGDNPEWASVSGNEGNAKTLTYNTFDNNNKSSDSFLVIPSATYELPVTVTYSVTQNGVVYSNCTATGNVALNLASATAYNLTLSVSLNAIEFGTATVTGWGDEQSLSGTI